MKEDVKDISVTDPVSAQGISRRKFLNYAGLAGAGLLVASCHKDDDDDTEPTDPEAVDLGSGDIGLLNYAYALEQLEAAFYTKVCSAFYDNITDIEKSYFSDIRNHEIAHREFFRNALGENAIPDLEFDFSSVSFNSRDSVITAAREMEDLGVAAYNGAGKLLVVPDNINLAGKIVSVEARHAAYLRELVSYNSFSDTADNNGIDISMPPADVLSSASKYFKSRLSGSKLPK